VAPNIIGICYDIYLLQMGFRPVAVVGKIVQKQARDSYTRKEKQNNQNNRETQNKQNGKQIYKEY
jgi:hypothetical protein